MNPTEKDVKRSNSLEFEFALSQVLFIIFVDKIYKCKQGTEGVPFGGIGTVSLFYEDHLVLLVSKNHGICGFQLVREVARIRIEYFIVTIYGTVRLKTVRELEIVTLILRPQFSL